MRKPGLSALSLASALLLACTATEAPPEVGTREEAIVGGALETGWAPVGALMQGGYTFCTGTLIGSNWVLTAGHCLDWITGPASSVSFFIGNDDAYATSSNTYTAGSLHVHPSYNPSTTANDIALMYLAETVPGTVATPVAINSSYLGSSYVGTSATYVGFGTFSGYEATDAGVKRRATLELAYVDTSTYSSYSTATVGVCAGDSGGPGLLQISGVWKIIGVNSTVGSDGPEPCLSGISNHTRVDAYATWINTTMGTPPPSCITTPSICMCPAACLSDGTCNNAVCTTYSCEDVIVCMNACASGDDACLQGCYDLGTDTAKSQYNALAQCASDSCGSVPDADFYTCLESHCASQYLACMPAANCDITGGDCPAGEACYPGFAGTTDCYASDENGLGEACNDTLTDRLSCADGLLCADLTGSALCYQFCTTAAVCAAGETCEKPVFDGIADIGICVCEDADADGYCATDDCVDTNAAVHPGAAEVCGDGLDNNCSGTADEGCPTPCTDADGDGACPPADCDDANATIHPGAADVCGDSLDNDCDGTADNDCPPCTDADGDGYCAPADCHDGDPAFSPAAAESCSDMLDNNCDGVVNEGCSGTPPTDDDDDDEGGGLFGCSAAPGGASGAPWMLGLAFALLAARRRRR